MLTSRRSFIKKSALAVAGSTFLSKKLLAGISAKEVTGLQLYSVREDMRTNPLGTLQKLSKMGYKVVEHAGYADRKFYGYAPTEFINILNDLGLKMYSGHVGFGLRDWDATRNDFTDEWKNTVEDAASVGQEFVITPALARSAQTDYDTLMKVIELWNKSGELCQKYGMKFGYHDDFNDDNKLHGMSLYDIIMKNCDPKLTIQQYDIANLYNAAGTDPKVVLKKYPGRFVSLHVKDVLGQKNARGSHDSTILGKGVLDVKDVVDLAAKNGAWLMIIEQEAYQNESPVDCVKDDLAVMKKWGY